MLAIASRAVRPELGCLIVNQWISSNPISRALRLFGYSIRGAICRASCIFDLYSVMMF